MKSYLEKITPSYQGYQELHIHSVGSYRDAVNSVTDIFDAAEELGRNAVAITDHGSWTRLFEALKERTKREIKILEQELTNIGASSDEIKKIKKIIGYFGTVRHPEPELKPFIERYETAFVETAKKSIQFIAGVEMYEMEDVPDDKHRYHIIFYAKDWQGAQALFAMCNIAQLNKIKSGSTEIPRCSMETMRKFIGEGTSGHGHVIATSACISGRLSRTLLRPLVLTQKINRLIESMEEGNTVSPESLSAALENINRITDEISDISAEIRETKKVAGKNTSKMLAKTRERLKVAIEKWQEKHKVDFEANLNEDPGIISIREKIAVLIETRARAEEAEKQLIVLNAKKENKKETLKEAKEIYKTLLKAAGPALKAQSRIEALQESLDTLPDPYAEATEIALAYNEIFGQGNFYIELQDHEMQEEFFVRNKLISIARENDIPLTVANDVHFKSPADKHKRDLVATMRFPDMTLSETESNETYQHLWFKTNEMMEELFSDVPDAIENTSRIAEQCNLYYKKEMHLPEFVDEQNGLSPAEYLKQLCRDNLYVRYPDFKKWGKAERDKVTERILYELGVIEKMGYSSYIAIVEDFISYAKKNFSPESIGPGRGSGAGSIVCYLIGITDIDPLRYGLIFERFLNPERVSMPKIIGRSL